MARSDTPQKRGKKKKRPLTTKQKKLVKGIAEGKSKRQAGLEAGYSPKSVSPVVSETLKNPNVQQALTDLMDQMGLGDETLLTVLKEGLQANKVVALVEIPTQKVGQKSKSGNEVPDAGPKTSSYAEVEDHATRHKFLDTALKIRGSYAAQKLAHEGAIEVVGVVVLPEVKEEAPSDSGDATS